MTQPRNLSLSKLSVVRKSSRKNKNETLKKPIKIDLKTFKSVIYVFLIKDFIINLSLKITNIFILAKIHFLLVFIFFDVLKMKEYS